MEKTKDKFLEEQEKDAQILKPFSFLFDAYYFSGYTANTASEMNSDATPQITCVHMNGPRELRVTKRPSESG